MKDEGFINVTFGHLSFVISLVIYDRGSEKAKGGTKQTDSHRYFQVMERATGTDNNPIILFLLT